MKLLRGLKHVSAFSGGTVATIGNFDGVHLGHQALLAELKSKSIAYHLPLVVLLFEPQPSEYFRGSGAPARLSSLREKLEQLALCGVDYVYCLAFNKTLAGMPAQQFAETYFFSLLRVKYLLIGEDFRFGHARGGDVHLLKAMAQNKQCIIDLFSTYTLDRQRVSSTKVREALVHTKLEVAKSLLGRRYSISGRVIRGAGLGRQWGIPTANIALRRLTLPLAGVFCVQIQRKNGDLVNGVANLGCRPTVDGSKNVLEVHLFDFNQTLYGEHLKVYFLYKLRDEIKFSSKDALIKQIYDDVQMAKNAFISGTIVTY